jgi:hypothetical protein
MGKINFESKNLVDLKLFECKILDLRQVGRELFLLKVIKLKIDLLALVM